ALNLLRTNAAPLLPLAAAAGAPLRWELLADLGQGVGEARLEAQYHRVNIHPADRYVLSVKGSSAFRLKSGESGFDNLFLAGDWTKSGLNVGCVEAAVMSGMQAAQAIG